MAEVFSAILFCLSGRFALKFTMSGSDFSGEGGIPMRVATSWSTEALPEVAVEQAWTTLVQRLGAEPDGLFLYASATYEAKALMKTLRALAPQVPLHGGTSCLGVMTEEGFHSQEGRGLGMLGIWDPEGAYGVGAAPVEGRPRQAAAIAVQRALEHAGRSGELPSLLWLTATPGWEEELLEGIEEMVGPNVPVIGGSAADNTVAGEWLLFGNGEVYSNAVVITALFPSTGVFYAFHSGYEPTEHRGKVTDAEGRILRAIDGRPAAQVYNEWTGGLLDGVLRAGGGNVLPLTTLYPLGREVGRIGNVPYFHLSHPETVTPEGAITLFTHVEPGQEIILMQGSQDALVRRAGRVARSALTSFGASADEVAGALVAYCAGCMLTVRERMGEVVEGIRWALGGRPFLGAFTFGEQGCFWGRENRHGNLMISVAALRA